MRAIEQSLEGRTPARLPAEVEELDARLRKVWVETYRTERARGIDHDLSQRHAWHAVAAARLRPQRDARQTCTDVLPKENSMTLKEQLAEALGLSRNAGVAEVILAIEQRLLADEERNGGDRADDPRVQLDELTKKTARERRLPYLQALGEVKQTETGRALVEKVAAFNAGG